MNHLILFLAINFDKCSKYIFRQSYTFLDLWSRLSEKQAYYNSVALLLEVYCCEAWKNYLKALAYNSKVQGFQRWEPDRSGVNSEVKLQLREPLLSKLLKSQKTIFNKAISF